MRHERAQQRLSRPARQHQLLRSEALAVAMGRVIAGEDVGEPPDFDGLTGVQELRAAFLQAGDGRSARGRWPQAFARAEELRPQIMQELALGLATASASAPASASSTAAVPAAAAAVTAPDPLAAAAATASATAAPTAVAAPTAATAARRLSSRSSRPAVRLDEEPEGPQWARVVRQRGADVAGHELATAGPPVAATATVAVTAAAAAEATAAAEAAAAEAAEAAEAAAFTLLGSEPPADIWLSACAALDRRAPHRDEWDSLPRDARLDRWGRARSFRSFPPPWATSGHRSWLYMPIILCAAGHPGGQQLLALRSPSCTAQPVASGGIGCIPHLAYRTEDVTPEEEAVYLQTQLTVLDFGILISTLSAALDSLRLTARDIERAFDGTLHLPAVLQDVIIGSAAPFHGRFMEVLEQTATVLIGWASRSERQRLARAADDVQPGTFYDPTLLQSDAGARSTLALAASAPEVHFAVDPAPRGFGVLPLAARPLPERDVRRLLSRVTAADGQGVPAGEPACAICLDADTEPGDPCAMMREPGARLTRSQGATAVAAASWAHLPCGHRFHHCCLVPALALHPSEISAHPERSYARMSCPVCQTGPGGRGTHCLAGFRPADTIRPGFAATPAALHLVSHTTDGSLDFDPPPPPPPPPPVHAAPLPPPGRTYRCPLGDPRAPGGLCQHTWRRPEDGLRHFQIQHTRAELHGFDLSPFGCHVCADCTSVCVEADADAHICGVCPPEAGDAELPPLLDPSPDAAGLPDSLQVPEAAWAALGSLSVDSVWELEHRFMQCGTVRAMPTACRDMLQHCVTVTLEAAVTSGDGGTIAPRHAALIHLLPRMLVTDGVFRRMSTQDRRRHRHRRRQAARRPADARAAAPAYSHERLIATFRTRCRLFLTGDWAPLLEIPPAIHRLTPERTTQRLARDVLALVREGEFSRAMSRADAADLAAAVESTIGCLDSLHPPDDHTLPAEDPQREQDLRSYGPAQQETPHLSREHFHTVVHRRLPRASAADHAGWRYEYLSWAYRYGSSWRQDRPRGDPAAFVPGRGADALYAFCDRLYGGRLPESVRPWFLGGRIVALRKEGDVADADASRRKLRPIAIGSVFGRVVSMIAALSFRDRFGAYLLPPDALSPAGAAASVAAGPLPCQFGVACASGLDALVHAVDAHLQIHPDWVDAAVDMRNAFNSMHRRAFFEVVGRDFPELFPWVSCMYDSPTELYFRRGGGVAPHVLLSRCGTRQGCPLGAQLYALGQHPLLCRLQRLIGSRGVVLAYADDIHILAPPSVVDEALRALAASVPPPASPPADPQPIDCRSRAIGLVCAPGKTTIYGPSLAHAGIDRERAMAALEPAVLTLRDPALSLEAGRHAMLRGDGIAARRGHPVLGAPLGDDAFVQDFVEGRAGQARRLLAILDRLLLADPEAPPTDSLGMYAPDERALLISFCLQPRLRHFGRLLAPGRVDRLLALHDSFFMDGYLRPLGGAEGLHLPIRRLARLCSRLGGHGQRATAPEPSADDEPRLSAAHCDSAWYGSWGSIWRRLRGWLPTLRGVSLAQSGDGAQLEFRTSLASAFDRISTSLADVRAHPHVTMLPIGYSLPVLHTALVDGSSEDSEHLDDDSAEADADARGPPQPSMLYDLDTLDSTTHPHAARAISAIVDAEEFLDLYQHADAAGQARLLDGSTPRGPSSWLRRIPRAPAFSASRGIFEFQHPADYPIALATDLQVRPPGSDHCRTCASATGGGLHPIGQDGRHWISCPHGIRLQRSVHHPVRDTLAWLLTAVLGERMVIRETPDGGGRMRAFMQRFPGLGHQPDIVLEGFDGRDSYTILEIKTCEPAGDTYIAHQHTATSRGAAHRFLEQTFAPGQYTMPAHQPGAPRLRLLTFVVSVRGALGSEAQTFIRQLSARIAGAVPYRLLDEASWATQGCAPLFRSAITFSARRALAAGIRRSTCSAAEAAYFERHDDQPAPDPARCFDCPVDPIPAAQ